MVKTATRSFCSSKPKTAWHRSSLSTYLLENCAKQSSSTLSIVYNLIQKIWSAWSIQTQYDCIRRRFQLMFFYANYNRKLAPPGDDKRFYSHDVSVMSRWHDDDRIIAVQPMVICCYCKEQVSVAPKDVCTPLCWRSINPSRFFVSHARKRRENGGSVNRGNQCWRR